MLIGGLDQPIERFVVENPPPGLIDGTRTIDPRVAFLHPLLRHGGRGLREIGTDPDAAREGQHQAQQRDVMPPYNH